MDDKLNPILVKEVRQATRGKAFRAMYWISLVAVTTFSCLMLLTDDVDDVGPEYVSMVMSCLIMALWLFVPVSAFGSMTREWDENTWDMLALTRLAPRQIVIGKFLSAGAQALLYISAFAPFLVVGYLLPGVDLGVLLILFGLALLFSSVLVAVGIGLASCAKNPLLRKLLWGVFAITLIFVLISSMSFASFVMFMPDELFDDDTVGMLVTFGTLGLAAITWAAAVASSNLAHEEENRSTGMRRLVTAWLVVLIVAAAIVADVVGQEEVFPVFGVMGAALIGLVSITAVAEPNTLGRRVARDVSTSSTWNPWLPGGARALTHVVLHFAWMMACLMIADQLIDPGINAEAHDWLLAVTCIAYMIAVILLPVRFAARLRDRKKFKSFVSPWVIAIVCFVVGLVVPAMVIGALGNGDPMEHPFNIFHALDEVDRGDRGDEGHAVVLILLAAIGLVISLPEMVRAWVEVRRLRRERVSGEADAAPVA